MSSSVDQIKSKIDIATLISSYIKLEKAGANFKGKCPFHNEKTPSFFVSPDRGSYYCFGCQAKGDIFTFVQEFEGLDFIGSLKVLADRAGVTLENYNAGEKTEKQRLHSVLEQAVFFYQKKLSENEPAYVYLRNRGVTEKTINDFRIGFAPAEWRDLFEFLLSKGVTEKDMLSVGLIKQKEGTSSFYDTFRGRVIFPINDSSGRVVGFSGRILVADDKSPKYLNSPETSLFNKSEILFGLDKAKNNIRLRDYSILVEGQMDLIMLHQAGITNAVASSGTALTENHLVKLRRLSNNLKMFFDGDSAGFAASNRAAKIALALGMDLKLVSMPEGKDPADLAKEDVEQLKKLLGEAKHIVDFYTEMLVAKGLDPRNLNYDLNMEIRKNVLPYIAQLNNETDKAHFIKSIMRKTFLNEEALWEDLRRIGTSSLNLPRADIHTTFPVKRIESIERMVLGIIIWQKENKNGQSGVYTEEIEKRAIKIFGDKFNELEDKYQKEKDLLLFEVESYYSDRTDLARDINNLLLMLEEEYLKKRFSVAMINLQKAEQSKNNEDISKYLEECQDISQQINKIKNTYEK
jgi:DNA primase